MTDRPMRFHQAVAFLPTRPGRALATASRRAGLRRHLRLRPPVQPPRPRVALHVLEARRTARRSGRTETPWPDPMCLISALAGATEHLLFTTGIYIAPVRDLITVAKTVGTAAVLSGNRVRLGVGVGWCKEEYVQTGPGLPHPGQAPRRDDRRPAGPVAGRLGRVPRRLLRRARVPDEPVAHRAGPHHRGRPLRRGPAPHRRAVRRLDRGRRLHRGRGLGAPRPSCTTRSSKAGRDDEGFTDLPVAQRASRRRPVPPLRGCRRDRLPVRPVDGRQRRARDPRRRGAGRRGWTLVRWFADEIVAKV